MSRVFLSLGSNQGDRAALLREAANRIQSTDGIAEFKVSSMYETAPVGKVDQPAFFNVAAELQTSIGPFELLRGLQRIETAMGRVRSVRWGPRTIDIDIIMYDQMVMQTESLTLPHPRARERAFVLIPLLELDPNLTLGRESIRRLLDELRQREEQSVVKVYSASEWYR